MKRIYVTLVSWILGCVMRLILTRVGWLSRLPRFVAQRVKELHVKAALSKVDAPLPERWAAAGFGPTPRNRWNSYDRSPWKQPWMNFENLSVFAAFSESVFAELRDTQGKRGQINEDVGFVGNIANFNYMRRNALVRHIPQIQVYLPQADKFIMSLPSWENFDGDITELGEEPVKTLLSRGLPENVCWLEVTSDWRNRLQNEEFSFIDPRHIMAWPSFMAHAPGLEVLRQHSALLVSQFPYYGILSKKPYIVAPMGGEIWFDAARDDEFGHITRLALKHAYCVLVSNPITLAHARRYGLSNCLYLPFPVDEYQYFPGPENDIRARWQQSSGGSFFILTSMRLDNQWKGAHIALEGFARFAQFAPDARLVVLGWGEDEAAAKEKLAGFGILNKVLLLPVVGKAKLARYLRAADALIEQLVLGYYGSSGLEAIASGLPVVMRLERDQYDALVPHGAPPVLDAYDACSVKARLRELYDDPVQRQNIGRRHREWFLATHSGKACWENYKLLFDAAANDIHISWSSSPLNVSLSDAEVSYFRDQMINAPEFPKYSI